MSDKDPNNPEWTPADFARARGADSMSAAERAAFPKTRGPQRAATKVPVSIRLDPDLVEALKAGGSGWQSRANGILREAVLGKTGASDVRGAASRVGRSPATGETIKVKVPRGTGVRSKKLTKQR